MPASISVVLPALNEADNLRLLVPELMALPEVGEVLLIDDASTDATPALAAELAQRFPGRFRSLQNSERVGLAPSVLQGLMGARYRFALVRDSDLSHPTKEIRRLVECGARGSGLAIASRYKSGWPMPGRLNDLFSAFLNSFLHGREPRISDWTLGFFLLDRNLLKGLPLGWVFQGRGEYSIRLYRALLQSDAISLSEIPVVLEPRGSGSAGTRTFRHGWAYLLALYGRVPGQGAVAVETLAAGWLRKKGAAGSGHGRLGLRTRLGLLASADPGLGPLLDLGCGNGAFTRQWLGESAVVDGVDSFAPALAAASASGYRAAYAARLPALPKEIQGVTYGAVLCAEAVQYLQWEEVRELFSACKQAGQRRFLCLLPNRASLPHRLRKWLRPGHADYSASHSLAQICAAASLEGWQLAEATGAFHGASRGRPLSVQNPSSWQSLAFLEFHLSN